MLKFPESPDAQAARAAGLSPYDDTRRLADWYVEYCRQLEITNAVNLAKHRNLIAEMERDSVEPHVIDKVRTLVAYVERMTAESRAKFVDDHSKLLKIYGEEP